jgi:catechol 2,3-dioxygenase-like lactoylglutathione lyase family enzyme
MLRGLSQLIFFAEDMKAARRWYTELLGMEPYFERVGPDGSLAYMEFRVGDYQHELGLIDRKYAPPVPRVARGAPWRTGMSTTSREHLRGCYPWAPKSTRHALSAGRGSSPGGGGPVREHPRSHLQSSVPGDSQARRSVRAAERQARHASWDAVITG